MTFKFDERPRKTIGQLFYNTSSFVHHFKVIGAFKLELHSRNAQFESNLVNFLSRVTLKFDERPSTWTLYPIVLCQAFCIISKPSADLNWSYSPETLNSSKSRRFFVPCDPEISRMYLGQNRVPLLYYVKLCALFHSHQWMQTGATVRKHPKWIKIGDILSRVT